MDWEYPPRIRRWNHLSVLLSLVYQSQIVSHFLDCLSQSLLLTNMCPLPVPWCHCLHTTASHQNCITQRSWCAFLPHTFITSLKGYMESSGILDPQHSAVKNKQTKYIRDILFQENKHSGSTTPEASPQPLKLLHVSLKRNI